MNLINWMNFMNLLHALSAFFVLSGIASFVVIILHIRSGHRQPMKIMEVVWPLTGLWANFIGLWGYLRIGKKKEHEKMMMNMASGEKMSPGMKMDDRSSMHGNPHPRWQKVALSTLHCGAGCTLADLTGEWFTYFVPVQIGGSLLAGQWVLDYALALIIGIFFQYAAIQPMEHLSTGKAIQKAFKVDFFSLTAWQVGMYGWMAIVYFLLFTHTPLPKTGWNFWFMMQIAMCFGFLTAYPVNRILIKLGIKHGM